MVASPSPAPIRVLLFASYAELFGSDALEVDSRVAPSVGRLLDHIRALPGGARLPATVLVAVNLAHVRGDAPLSAGDEVALLPPLAGG